MLGRYTQADRWTLRIEPYIDAPANPLVAIDPAGRGTIRQARLTSLRSTQMRRLVAAEGCMDDQLKFFCDCKCVPSVGFKKEMKLISPSFEIYAATNAAAGGKIVPVDLIVAEEMKHVTWFQQWLPNIKDSLEVLESTPYPNYKDCVKGCKTIFKWLKGKIKSGSQAVDATHPKY